MGMNIGDRLTGMINCIIHSGTITASNLITLDHAYDPSDPWRFTYDAVAAPIIGESSNTISAAKRADKSKPVPLYFDHTYEFWADIDITFRGELDASVWTEIDVMGCNGTRYAEDEFGETMLDDDGIPRTEKVYGSFKVIWTEEEPASFGLFSGGASFG